MSHPLPSSVPATSVTTTSEHLQPTSAPTPTINKDDGKDTFLTQKTIVGIVVFSILGISLCLLFTVCACAMVCRRLSRKRQMTGNVESLSQKRKMACNASLESFSRKGIETIISSQPLAKECFIDLQSNPCYSTSGIPSQLLTLDFKMDLNASYSVIKVDSNAENASSPVYDAVTDLPHPQTNLQFNVYDRLASIEAKDSFDDETDNTSNHDYENASLKLSFQQESSCHTKDGNSTSPKQTPNDASSSVSEQVKRLSTISESYVNELDAPASPSYENIDFKDRSLHHWKVQSSNSLPHLQSCDYDISVLKELKRKHSKNVR